MAFRLLVNAGLLVIPIGGSLGALFGIDAHLAATGQAPLFSNDNSDNYGSGSGGNTGGSTGGGSGGSGSTTNNGVTNTQYCEKSYGISPPSDGANFTCMLLITALGARFGCQLRWLAYVYYSHKMWLTTP